MQPFRILAIEDDVRIHMMYEKTFPSPMFDLTVKNNGREGIDFHNSTPAELIILDMLMPVMTGYASLIEIRKKMKDITTPIIMVTSKKSKQDIDMCTVLGISGFIIKPFDVAVLRDKVVDLLGAIDPERTAKLQDLQETALGIKSKVNILTVAKDLITTLTPFEGNYVGDCPIKTGCRAKKGSVPGTIVINEKRGEFHCKSCNSSGDLLKLIGLSLEKNPEQSLEYLQSRFIK